MKKNYFRDKLLDLIKETKGKPIILRCKYKERNNNEWVIFSTIRPYIPYFKTKTICDHVHIKRIEAEKYFDFTAEHHNRTFYIICYPWFYSYNGLVRGTIKLAKGLPVKPILFNTEKGLIDKIWHACYKFDSEWYRDKEWDRLNALQNDSV